MRPTYSRLLVKLYEPPSEPSTGLIMTAAVSVAPRMVRATVVAVGDAVSCARNGDEVLIVNPLADVAGAYSTVYEGSQHFIIEEPDVLAVLEV
jgi:co-chaperonin GroES (HSP10)